MKYLTRFSQHIYVVRRVYCDYSNDSTSTSSDLSGCCRRSIKSSQLYSPFQADLAQQREKSRVLCQKVYVKLPWTPISSFCYFSSLFSSSRCSCRCLFFVHCSTYHSMQADPSIGGGRQSQRLDCTTEERKKEQKMTALMLHFCLVF